MTDFIQRLNSVMPMQDKYIIPIGAAVSGASLLTQIQTILGIVLLVLTILIAIPRVVAAWKSDKDEPKK